MDACKAAVKALRNSPAAVRRKISGSTSSTRMERLREDWLNENDAVMAGISFFVKFLGSVGVDQTSGQGCTDRAVRKICVSAKEQKEKLEKISLRVSAKSISMSTLSSDARTVEYPIYKVTYCTVDTYNDKIFTFIAQCPKTLDILCYAFLCNKKSKAMAVTLSVAQAFNIAFEMWESTKEQQQADEAGQKNGADSTTRHPSLRHRTRSEGGAIGNRVSNGHNTSRGSLDLVLEGRQQPVATRVGTAPTSNGHSEAMISTVNGDTLRSCSDGAVSDEELDAEFTRLAQARSTPNLLDIGRIHIRAPADITAGGGTGAGSSDEKLDEYKNGESNPSVLFRMVSREDLISPTTSPESPSGTSL
ncbi:low density lipoprotein receptor adapter protein 1-like isoform X1 [Sycon ciliatum]|uniref:low density lipoprotein receptor adapter protein 1-like isoform X1 n=1 Tax=Sycon ciliatum TaxID=27933 RepID=UPI0031F65D00